MLVEKGDSDFSFGNKAREGRHGKLSWTLLIHCSIFA